MSTSSRTVGNTNSNNGYNTGIENLANNYPNYRQTFENALKTHPLFPKLSTALKDTIREYFQRYVDANGDIRANAVKKFVASTVQKEYRPYFSRRERQQYGLSDANIVQFANTVNHLNKNNTNGARMIQNAKARFLAEKQKRPRANSHTTVENAKFEAEMGVKRESNNQNNANTQRYIELIQTMPLNAAKKALQSYMTVVGPAQYKKLVNKLPNGELKNVANKVVNIVKRNSRRPQVFASPKVALDVLEKRFQRQPQNLQQARTQMAYNLGHLHSQQQNMRHLLDPTINPLVGDEFDVPNTAENALYYAIIQGIEYNNVGKFIRDQRRVNIQSKYLFQRVNSWIARFRSKVPVPPNSHADYVVIHAITQFVRVPIVVCKPGTTNGGAPVYIKVEQHGLNFKNTLRKPLFIVRYPDNTYGVLVNVKSISHILGGGGGSNPAAPHSQQQQPPFASPLQGSSGGGGMFSGNSDNMMWGWWVVGVSSVVSSIVSMVRRSVTQ